MKLVTDKLFAYQDLDYKKFNEKLIPNVNGDTIIGVRFPDIRKIAKDMKDESCIQEFVLELPHKYHEEYLLHGIILNTKYKDIYKLLDEIDIFLEYANNWSVTDTINPKIFEKYPDEVYQYIEKWIKSNKTYKIRCGVVCLLHFYLNEKLNAKIFNLVNSIKNDDYYVKMAVAWFYSFALVKEYDKTISYFEKGKLDKWIHNKAIQKAIESYRISKEKKDYLRNLKIR